MPRREAAHNRDGVEEQQTMIGKQHSDSGNAGPDRSPSKGRTFVLVVVAGILATVAIPRVVTARADWTEAAAMADLDLATRAIAAYYAEHGRYPATSGAAGFEPAPGTTVSVWDVQTVNGRESVHVHLSSVATSKLYHVHFPAESDIAVMP